VQPIIVRDGTADVSRQSTLLFQHPSWLLLSEPTSVLRVLGDKTPSTISITAKGVHATAFGATRVREQGWRVPSDDNGPEFFVMGDVATTTRNVGPFRVRYVADNSARVERLGLESLHSRVLSYLANVLPPPVSVAESERTLLIVWIGITEGSGRSGGAAGSRSFLANYTIPQSLDERADQSRTTMVMAHEQFHQLADLVRGSRPALPLWLNESLASYYGLKTLAQVSSSRAAEALRDAFINPSRPVDVGLLELDRRRAAGDGSAYQTIYEQGATFWAELDRAASESSTSTGGIDSLIPSLIQSQIESGESLPHDFIARLHAIVGSKADEIISKYVGK
jgi:hypothetical protein